VSPVLHVSVPRAAMRQPAVIVCCLCMTENYLTMTITAIRM
jgi:hypothetical protein